MDSDQEQEFEGQWEFECCGGNNVEFQRAEGLEANVHEGECFLCGTRYQVIKFNKRRRDSGPHEGQPHPSSPLALVLAR